MHQPHLALPLRARHLDLEPMRARRRDELKGLRRGGRPSPDRQRDEKNDKPRNP